MSGSKQGKVKTTASSSYARGFDGRDPQNHTNKTGILDSEASQEAASALLGSAGKIDVSDVTKSEHDNKENTTEVPVIHRIGFARAIRAHLQDDSTEHDNEQNTSHIPVIHRTGFARAIQADLQNDGTEDQLKSDDEEYSDEEFDDEERYLANLDNEDYMHSEDIKYDEEELRQITRVVQSSDGTFKVTNVEERVVRHTRSSVLTVSGPEEGESMTDWVRGVFDLNGD